VRKNTKKSEYPYIFNQIKPQSQKRMNFDVIARQQERHFHNFPLRNKPYSHLSSPFENTVAFQAK
jgi:hypothetical protein